MKDALRDGLTTVETVQEERTVTEFVRKEQVELDDDTAADPKRTGRE